MVAYLQLIVLYIFFNNSVLIYDLFRSSSFEQINLLTKKHLGFFPDCQVLQCVWVCLLYPAHFTPMELRYVYPQKYIRIFKDPKHVWKKGYLINNINFDFVTFIFLNFRPCGYNLYNVNMFLGTDPCFDHHDFVCLHLSEAIC